MTKLFKATALGLLLLLAKGALAEEYAVIGTIGKNVTSPITFQVVVTQIIGLPAGAETSLEIANVGENTEIVPTDPNSEVAVALGYYAVITPQPIEQGGPGGNPTQTFDVELRDLQSGRLASLVTTEGLKLSVEYFVGTEGQTRKDVTLPREFRVAVVAPTFKGGDAAIRPLNQGLRIAFDSPATITVDDPTSADAPAALATTNVSVFAIAIDTRILNATLPAFLYSGSTGTDTADECTFSGVSEASPAQCVSCGENVYLDVANLSGDLIKVGSSSVASGAVTIKGLENDATYNVLLMYQSDGIARSDCRVASPVADISWSEINGADEATPEKFTCFIATAAYGSAFHEDLAYFRWFRDRHLLTNTFGKVFVSTYYELSPPAAQSIAYNPPLQTATRIALWPLAKFLQGLFWLEHGRFAKLPE